MDSTRRTLLILLAAVIIVVMVTGLYVYTGEKPSAATGEIVKLEVFPIHSQLRVGEGAKGIEGGMETYDQLLVLAQIRIHNQGKIPLFLRDVSASLDLSNGDSQHSTAASRSDFQNVFVAYPQLASLKEDPLPWDLTLQPGQTVEGLAIFHYPITKQQWDARQSFHGTISFQYQKDLLLPWPPENK
jgi:hypothetical protein